MDWVNLLLVFTTCRRKYSCNTVEKGTKKVS